MPLGGQAAAAAAADSLGAQEAVGREDEQGQGQRQRDERRQEGQEDEQESEKVQRKEQSQTQERGQIQTQERRQEGQERQEQEHDRGQEQGQERQKQEHDRGQEQGQEGEQEQGRDGVQGNERWLGASSLCHQQGLGLDYEPGGATGDARDSHGSRSGAEGRQGSYDSSSLVASTAPSPLLGVGHDGHDSSSCLYTTTSAPSPLLVGPLAAAAELQSMLSLPLNSSLQVGREYPILLQPLPDTATAPP